ncbi:MAG: response regulator [Gammaproteobacteria bacterium]|nr:response regulator [Gammaproteobacteria bacterium]
MQNTAHHINILLVEDNPGDARLAQEGIKELGFQHTLSIVDDGLKAINYLHRQGEFENVSQPDLILLDLNLPKKSGKEVLAEIKEDIHLRTIPVVVLSTSKSEKDISEVYNLHGNCYITKPVDFEEFVNVVKTINNFWFNLVKLPKENN